MKCLFVLAALVAYCSGDAIRVRSSYKDGVKWELSTSGIGNSRQADTVSGAWKKGAALPAFVSDEWGAYGVVAPSTGYEKYFEESPLGYEKQIPPGYKKQEPIPEGIHIEKPVVQGLYQQPYAAAASLGYGKEVPTQQAAVHSTAAIRTAGRNSAEINAVPVPWHQQAVHSVPTAHQDYYVVL